MTGRVELPPSMRRSVGSIVPALAAVVLMAFPSSPRAQNCTGFIGSPQSGGTIGVFGLGISSSTMSSAFGLWSSCTGYGTSMPQFAVGTPNQNYQNSVSVVLHSGHNPFVNVCGAATPMNSNGSSQIELWENVNIPGVGVVSCAPYGDTLGHELGHSLGLAESLCNGYLMGLRNYSTSTGWQPRDPAQPDECATADANWTTPEEETPREPPHGGPMDPPIPPGTPILVDLERNRFHLTGLADPVFFDIDADGDLEVLAWTSADALDAFLVLDRNGNGTVDSGAELFGDVTPLIDGSTAENGYIPLAEFDLGAMGGNGNGLIDAGDVIYPELQLWIDLDHDGLSEPGELWSLADAGVTRLDLQYWETRIHDGHGNYFRYVGRAWILVDGDEKRTWTTDVFFVVGE